ncbi:MAG: DUF4388 domain-containing protein [Candidatus Obscuribacterales bacterium]|nr:DUF4388 domain-containing protein [Candidatus Obscuribacterales bacterium]
MSKPGTSRTVSISAVGIVRHFLSTYGLRMCCLVAFVLAITIAFDRFYQDFILPKEAIKFAREVSGRKNPKAEWNHFDFIDEARKRGCVWLFFASPAGKLDKDNPMPPPPIKKFYPVSRTYTYGGERFFDAASNTQFGTFHAGFRNDYLVQRLAHGSSSMPIFLAILGAFAAAWIGSYVWLALPLKRVSYRLRALMQGHRSGNLDQTITGIDYEIVELKELCSAIKELILDNRRLLRINTIDQQIQDLTSDRIPSLHVKKADGRRTGNKSNNTHGESEVNAQARLLDPLTGLLSVSFVSEHLVPTFDSGQNNQDPYSVLLVSVKVSDSEDHGQRDRKIKALAEAISASVRTEELLMNKLSRYTDYVVRYTSNCMAVVLGWADHGNAKQVATRIVASFPQYMAAQGLDAKLKPCVGMASYPTEGENMPSLLASAFSALMFAEREFGMGAIKTAGEVPSDYKKGDSKAVMKGELGVLGGFGLLQSLASSNKTGELMVNQEGQSSLRVLFQDGKPLEVSFGELTGKEALVDFLISYKEGRFQFTERGFSRGTQVIIQQKTPLSLERCLMDAAVAEDHMVVAKRMLRLEDCIISVNPEEQMEKLFNKRTDLTEEEKNGMRTLVATLENAATLAQLFEKVKMPDYIKWRAAHLLSEAEVIQLMADELV